MKKILMLGLLFFVGSISNAQDNGKFYSLFNGKNLDGWYQERPDGFEVINGELVTKSYGAGNDIYTKKQYTNYIFRFDFLLSKVGNSGIFIRCKTSDQSAGFEVQLLAPWTPWRDDLHCTGSLYGHAAVKDRPDETTGKWYSMEIKCDRNIITVLIDGKFITAAKVDTIKSLVDKPLCGVIGIQGNHSNKGEYAKFRNLYLRDLDAEPEYVIKGFYEQNEKIRALAQTSAVILSDRIIPFLGLVIEENNPMVKDCAKQVMFDIVSNASKNGTSKKQRREINLAIRKIIEECASTSTKSYLNWLLGMIKN